MRVAAAAIAASLALSGTAAQAQQGPGRAQGLEDLIPDAAVENPESWAEQGATDPQPMQDDDDQAVVQSIEPEIEEDEPLVEFTGQLDPDTPLSDSSGISIEWPDESMLPQFVELEPESGIEFAESALQLPEVPPGIEEQISDELTLIFPADPAAFPIREEFVERFDDLSTIVELDGDEDDLARVSARAEEDEQLLLRLLRIYGYFNGQVLRTVEGLVPGESAEPSEPHARFDIIPGTQYRFGAIDLGQLAEAGSDYPALRDSFQIFAGDPLLQDKIVEERNDLGTALGESGYPFADMSNPRLLVDHDREEGDLTMRVQPGGKYRFGAVISSDPEYLSSEHLSEIARFEPGEIYRLSDQLDLRSAILATGLVGSVGITPQEVSPPANGEPGTVDLKVEMTRAPARTLAGAIGYGTGEGLRLEGSWEHRNMFPPEGMLRFRGIAGTREQLAGVTFRRNNFKGRDQVLTLDAYATRQDRDAYKASTASVVGTFEKLSTILYQKPLSWSGGLEILATSESEALADGTFGDDVTYFIAAIPLQVLYDTSDSLLDPTRGFRVGGKVSPEVSHHDGLTSFYVRTQVDASYYKQMSESIVLATRGRLGSTMGTELANIAPSRRFYAGGGSSVRGYGYQEIGPRNDEDEPNGGRSLLEWSLEARIKTGLMGGNVAVVPFIDAGTVSRSTTPTFDDIKVGVGVGLRYYTSFGPLRIDVATPVNPEPDDSRIGVYVSLGQAF